jgi:hypothetical protein
MEYMRSTFAMAARFVPLPGDDLVVRPFLRAGVGGSSESPSLASSMASESSSDPSSSDEPWKSSESRSSGSLGRAFFLGCRAELPFEDLGGFSEAALFLFAAFLKYGDVESASTDCFRDSSGKFEQCPFIKVPYVCNSRSAPSPDQHATGMRRNVLS